MDWADLPFKLKAYIVIIACSALPIVVWAGWRICTERYENLWFILLTGFALFSIFFFLHLPHFKAAITVGDSYIMAIAMMYGVAPCVVATFLYILIISIASQKKVSTHRVVFNVASTTCGAWLYSSLFRAIGQGSLSSTDIVVPAAVLTLTYFLFNSISTSIAISWSLGESVFKFWIKTCIPLSIDFMCMRRNYGRSLWR